MDYLDRIWGYILGFTKNTDTHTDMHLPMVNSFYAMRKRSRVKDGDVVAQHMN